MTQYNYDFTTPKQPKSHKVLRNAAHGLYLLKLNDNKGETYTLKFVIK